MQIAEAFVAIRPDAKGFKADVERDVETPLRNVKSLVAGLAVGAAAISFAKGGLDELKEQQAVAAKLEATLKATGGAANVTADQLDEMASSLQDLTGEDAEAIKGGQALLLQFTKVRNEVGEGNAIFDRASQAAMDLAAATGTDTAAAFQTLGRALEDPLQGTRALRAANVILTEAQKQQIASMVAQGDQLGAQRYILDLLEAKVGGVAEALGETLPQKLKRAKNAMDDVKASVVSAAAPALEAAATLATKGADAFGSLPAPVQTGALAFGALAVAAGPASTALEGARTVLSGLRAAFDGAAVGAFNLAGQGLGSIALQGAAATAVVAGLYVGIQKMRSEMEAAEKAGNDAAKAVAERSSRDSFDGVEARLGRLKGALADLNNEGQRNPFNFLDADYTAQIDAYRDKLGLTGLVMQGQVEAAKQLAAARGISVEAAWREIQAAQKAKEGHDDEKVSTDKVTEAYKRQADAMQKVADARNRQVDAITSLGSDVAGYEAAQADVVAARQALAGARTPQEQKAALEALEAAIRKQADARLRVAETQAKANDTELTAAERASLYRDELDKLSAGLPALRAQLDPTIVLLDQVAQDRTANIHVQVSGVEDLLAQLYKAQYELELMRKEASGMSKEEAFATTPWPGTPRATGGPVRAGHAYWVGEHGAEPFIPDTDGTILPAGSSMGGTSIYAPITVYGHDYSLDEAGRQFSARIGELVGGAQR